uniref:Uncharacterized protein n=1 Tax=Globodera pallida TaxID=36090 RepID=A0A183BSF1_GLOPA
MSNTNSTYVLSTATGSPTVNRTSQYVTGASSVRPPSGDVPGNNNANDVAAASNAGMGTVYAEQLEPGSRPHTQDHYKMELAPSKKPPQN